MGSMSKGNNTYKSCPRVIINGKKKRISHIVMEKMLGRPLEPDEVVHHIDGDPQNNVFSNLEVMVRSDHTKLHNPKDFFRCGVSAADNKAGWGKHYWRERACEMGIEPKVFKINKEIYFIIIRFLSEGLRQWEIAEIFDVNQSTISRIKTGKRFDYFKKEEIT